MLKIKEAPTQNLTLFYNSEVNLKMYILNGDKFKQLTDHRQLSKWAIVCAFT